MNSAIQAGADSRDMIGAHVSYRREFGAVPQIVSAVAADDTARAAVVAAHIQLIVNQLHAHHTSEDDGVWPKLHERCPAELEPLVVTMEEQHLSLDRHLRELETSAQRWAGTGSAADRDSVVDAAERLLPPLHEHLDLEEEKVLPLIDGYLSQREWDAVVHSGVEKIPKSKLLLIMGITLYDSDAEMRRIMSKSMPSWLWPVMARLGRRSYASHAKRVYGTATPPHYV